MLIGVIGELGFLVIFPEFYGQLIKAQNERDLLIAINIVGPIGIFAGILFFFGTALVPSMLAFVGDKASHDLRGSAMGLYRFMLSIGMAVGTILAAIFADDGRVQAAVFVGAAIF